MGSLTAKAQQLSSPVRITGPDDYHWDSRFTMSGLGLNNVVLAMRPAPNGDVIVGGTFTDAGGNPDADCIARWDGNQWHALGQGFQGGPVLSLTYLPNGNLLAAGGFTSASNIPNTACLAQWDGSNWQPFNPPFTNTPAPVVLAVASTPAGEVIVGGLFGRTGPTQSLTKWNGTNWVGFPNNPIDNVLFCILSMPNNDIFVGGSGSSSIARWDNTTWQSMGNFSGIVYYLALARNGDVLAGGHFTIRTATDTINCLARWDGTKWHSIGTPISPGSTVLAIHEAANGDILIGGTFVAAGSNTLANKIARWDGQTWQNMGTGLNDFPEEILIGANDQVYVGGHFTTVGDSSKAVSHFGIYNPHAVGLQETITPLPFTLSPNPAHGTVRLTHAPANQAEIIDPLGRVVRKFTLEPRTSNLNLQDLAPGLYVVQCGGQRRRLVIE